MCIDGQPFSRARGRAKRAVQKRIGTIYQDFALVEPVSCRQNVLNACLPDMALPAALLGLQMLLSRSSKKGLWKKLAPDEMIKQYKGQMSVSAELYFRWSSCKSTMYSRGKSSFMMHMACMELLLLM